LGATLTLTGTDAKGEAVYFAEEQIVKGDSAIILEKNGTTLKYLSGSTSTLIKNLPDGTYTLSENGAPAGYDVTTDITFEIKDGKVVDSSYVTAANGNNPAVVTMKDAMFKADVAISKVDTEGGKELPCAELILKGTTVGGKDVVIDKSTVELGDGASIDESYTGSGIKYISGTEPTLIKNLPDGTYTLTENAAPAGYALTTDITFVIENGKVKSSEFVTEAQGNNPAVVTMKDAMFKTDVAISKVDTEGGKELPGAELILTGKDAKGDDVVIDKSSVELGDGASIDESYTGSGIKYTSGETATLIKNLPDGTYTLSENAAPAGYAVTTDITFVIENGKVKSSAYVTDALGNSPAVVTMKDSLLTDDVVFSKVDASGYELPGATLVLSGKDFKGNAISFTDSQVNLGEKAELKNTGDEVRFVSGTETTTISNLPAGVYTLTELTAPQGFAKAETITFELTTDMKIIVDGKEVDKIQMVDDHITDVVISKVDTEGGKELPGAELILTGKTVDGNDVVIDKSIVELGEGAFIDESYTGSGIKYTSGETATLIKNLPDGTYTLTENAAPAGYDVTTDITFVIENGKVKSSEYVTEAQGNNPAIVTMKDAAYKTDVVISKVDTEGGNELPGAELILTGTDFAGNDVVIDKSSVELGEKASIDEDYTGSGIKYTSGETATLIKNLPDGTYTLSENAAPAGYDVTTDITFEIKDGKVVDSSYVTAANGNNPAVVTMKDAAYKTDVVISKVDTEGGKELPGAELILTGKDAKGDDVVIDKSSVELGEKASIDEEYTGSGIKYTSGETATLIKNLPDGTYTLSENAAPAGYAVTTDITFEIKDGKVVDSSYVTAANGNNPAVVTMKDALNKTDVFISKVDTEGGNELPGAELILTGTDFAGNDVVIDQSSVELGEKASIDEDYTESGIKYTSGETATLIKGLPDGTYTLSENAAPAGYDVTTDITFVIENGKVKSSEYVTEAQGNNPAIVTMKDAAYKTDVVISKVDTDSGDELLGATLTLTGTDAKGEAVYFAEEQIVKGDSAIILEKNGTTLKY
ncbi:MAG: hypothetical protein J6U23_00105, partial [Clostridiales bacterium]|nr:hypothetical protein [Clostridiales bacterium]